MRTIIGHLLQFCAAGGHVLYISSKFRNFLPMFVNSIFKIKKIQIQDVKYLHAIFASIYQPIEYPAHRDLRRECGFLNTPIII